MSYQLTTAELIDRLSIVVMKLAHGADVVHEKNLLIKELDAHLDGAGNFYYGVICVSVINAFIWINEDSVRSLDHSDMAAIGKQLLKTHAWNSDRSNAKAWINKLTSERIDPKLNYSGGAWSERLFKEITL